MTQVVRSPSLWIPFVRVLSNPSQPAYKTTLEGYLEELFCRFVAGFTSGAATNRVDSSSWFDQLVCTRETDCKATEQHWKYELMQLVATLLTSSPDSSNIQLFGSVLDAAASQVQQPLVWSTDDSLPH